MDLYFTEAGDIAVSPSGDFALTPSPWRDFSQQAYIALMTQKGDYIPYPNIGANLEYIIGMPQTPNTGELGCQLIKDALSINPRFNGISVDVKACPTGPQSIRFDVYVTAGSRTDVVLSIEQPIGTE